jgi:glycosyltransferase involved in cell wall biosynthesis
MGIFLSFEKIIMTKKRILMCAESSHLGSGFGNYTKNVLQYLYNTQKYEIAELSCYRDTDVPKTESWRVYPVAVKPNHPLYKEYTSNEANQFGQWRFELALLDFKPNIVFDIRDFWNFTYQETSPFRNFYHWVIAPTYDSAPPKLETINSFYNADTLCFHTEWAKDNLLNDYRYLGSNIGPVVNDAIDHNIFKPCENKKQHRAKYGISDDIVIIGSVMRNQKRKLIPDIIKQFAELSRSKKDKHLVLYLHTSYPDGLAWDLPTILLEHNIADKVLLTYKCTKCQKFFPSIFKGVKTVCQHCLNNSATICGIKNSLEMSQLSEIYNLFDIYIQYAICEGFGIPPIEAAACGVPVISVNYQAMAEVGNKIGAELINVIRIFREQETNADRSYPNNTELYDVLHKYISLDKSKLIEMGIKCREKCLQSYSWEATAQKFEKLFDSIDINKKMNWSCSRRNINTEINIKSQSNYRDMIYEIIDKVIQEPFLKNTNFIEELIKHCNDGYIQHGSKSLTFNIKSCISILETYMRNKMSLETLRTNESLILAERVKDFIDYSKQ